jgi:hypothetical protein
MQLCNRIPPLHMCAAVQFVSGDLKAAGEAQALKDKAANLYPQACVFKSANGDHGANGTSNGSTSHPESAEGK